MNVVGNLRSASVESSSIDGGCRDRATKSIYQWMGVKVVRACVNMKVASFADGILN